MAEKTKKNQKPTQTKTTGAIEEEISIEENEVEIHSEKPEKKQEDSKKPEKERKESLMFGDMISETVKLLINQTYLRESENKITTEEMKDTEFGKNLANTMDYYFPSWNFEHPLFGLVASSGMLLVLLNQKAPVKVYDDETKIEGESEGNDKGSRERSEDGEDISSANPYVNIPKE